MGVGGAGRGRERYKEDDENEKREAFGCIYKFSLLSSSSYSQLSLLPLQLLFNSPHPLIPSHGVAKRIMGNEMAYLLLPRGETEKEERGGKKRSQRQNKTKKGSGKTELVKECV